MSRRAFIALGTGALTTWLAGCSHSPETTELASPYPAPTDAPPPAPATTITRPEPSPQPTPTPQPEYTPVPATPASPTTVSRENQDQGAKSGESLDRAALTAHWPRTPASRVIRVRHDGVWSGEEPDAETVLLMLDAGLSALTDATDVFKVWRTLFEPDERVLLKVNCIARGGPTQPPVTYAVAQRLQEAGVAAENILIFDRTDRELEAAGYTLNDSGSGVQCRGTRGTGSELSLTQATVRFSQEIDEYDTIINIPTPKQHSVSGVSVSLKNHYGSINRPGALHGNWCDPAIAELNAQQLIGEKTRLVVAAALNVTPGDWNRPERDNSLLLSFDPVALDTVARDILVSHREDSGRSTEYLIRQSTHLTTAQSLRVGATDPALIDLRELALA